MHRGAVGRAALHPTCVHPQCTTHTQSVLLCTQHTRLDLLLAGAIINTPHIEGGADVAAHIHMVCANADARIHRVCAVVRTSSSCGVGGYLHPVMAICTGVHSQIITTRQDSGTHRYLCTKYALISSLACMRPARTHTGCVCMCKKVTCTPPNIPHKHTGNNTPCHAPQRQQHRCAADLTDLLLRCHCYYYCSSCCRWYYRLWWWRRCCCPARWQKKMPLLLHPAV